jgi:hypothetical protein
MWHSTPANDGENDETGDIALTAQYPPFFAPNRGNAPARCRKKAKNGQCNP